ncbi:MAG: hypothetical protein IGS03_18210 [Candidatus Sericytochromatia bacterium]|nr:hypothetical protein [Candidatus Sericytochromatia bacterium]
MQKYPPLKVKPDFSPHVFVERLAEIAAETPDYQAELSEADDSDTLMLSLKCGTVEIPDLEARVISARRTDVKHVHVRLNSPAWQKNIPDYEDYTALGKSILDPLLKDYNRRHKTRLRLTVKSLDTLAPKLTTKIHQAFEDFVQHAHKNLLGGQDWERYYRFIRLTHAFQVKLDEEQIFYLLVQAGFDRQYAREISDVYLHGRALLAN